MKNQYKSVFIALINLMICGLTLLFMIDRYQKLDFVEVNCTIINGTLIYESQPEAHYYLLLNISIFNRTLDAYNYVCSKRNYCEQWLEDNINKREACLYSKRNDKVAISIISNPYLALNIIIDFLSILVLILVILVIYSIHNCIYGAV
jgi:hypothetical protein